MAGVTRKVDGTPGSHYIDNCPVLRFALCHGGSTSGNRQRKMFGGSRLQSSAEISAHGGLHGDRSRHANEGAIGQYLWPNGTNLLSNRRRRFTAGQRLQSSTDYGCSFSLCAF